MRLTSEGREPRRVADSIVAIWLDIDRALSPVIGERGVSAVYKRSVNLIRADFPWLWRAYEGVPDQGQFVVLGTQISQQSTSNGLTANIALLHAFCNLLENLIGKALTDRLLRTALDNRPTGAAIQEIES